MKLDFIKNAFDNFETELSQDGETITILNPYSNSNIIVDYEFFVSTDGLDSFEQYTTQFSYQHRHFTTENEVLEWIKSITEGSLLAIEFFIGTNNCFGGEIPFSSIKQLTYDIFVKEYDFYSGFSQCDNFKIRSWNCKNDYDGCILKNKENEFYIVINKI